MGKEDVLVLEALQENLARCLLGKSTQIKLILTALLAGGHVLLEDVPGTGKTLLIKALAQSIQGQFRRIQCNPDLLPTDITGVSIYHPREEEFVFRPGPVMTNILLTDEINRATTKTQSALLEAMEEKHITVDGEIYALPKPFLVMATQNPIEFEGTYLLPEAQLDRFMMKFQIGYPDKQTEKDMLSAFSKANPLEQLEAITNMEDILSMQDRVKEIHVDDELTDYIINIVRATRDHTSIFLGASPRATLSLMQGVKALAFLNARDFVIPDDVKFLAPYVFLHRLVLHPEARMGGATVETILQTIMEQVKVPIGLEK